MRRPRYRSTGIWLSAWLAVSPTSAQDAPSEPTRVETSPPEYGAVATATRLARPISDVSASVTVITRREIELNPSLTSDSLLRSVPSVAVFRRSSSLSADPSSQGLNLRGIGPSGVSRTLVLLDGVPVNDPFAGSVYFRGLPRLGLGRAEIVPGGGSALYGSSALSGVVQLFARDEPGTRADADASYGLANTAQLAGRVAVGGDAARGSLEGEWLRSDGFPVVAEADRGAVDRPAESGSGNLIARAGFAPAARWSLAPTFSLFRQDLRGATRFTSARAELAVSSLRVRYDARSAGKLELLLFARLAQFEQSRARIIDERAAETLAARQQVPAADQGGSLIWSSSEPRTGLGHVLLAGLDARHVAGNARERLFPPEPGPQSVVRRAAGGQQVLFGAFVQDLWRLQRWLELDGALRVDYYQNYAGDQQTRTVDDASTRRTFARRDYWAVNPRLGALIEATDWLRIRASAYRSFRAPTLNELYRPFQVGTVLTAANPDLKPEFLTGAEAGVELLPWRALSLRITGFGNALENPVTNATLSEPLDDGATRARRNLRLARVRGAELGVDVRLQKRWSLLVGYTLVDARVVRRGPVEGVTGKRLAQDPVHRASALLLFDDPHYLTASLQIRATGVQYEDDLNTLRMRAYAVVDAFVARRLAWDIEAFAAVENLLDQTYLVGRAGVDTVGTPLLARIGLRLRHAFVP